MIGERIQTNEESIGKKVKRLGKRNLVICASVLIVALAVCINWVIFSGSAATTPDDVPTGGEQTGGETDGTTDTSTDDSVASYFASVQISRQQARDEALEVLQMVIDSDSALESAKAEAISDVSRIADEIASEANIETLIRAKGFEDCVAVISDGLANIVVKTDSALMQNEVAQIMEIVYEQANIAPANIKITEKIGS